MPAHSTTRLLMTPAAVAAAAADVWPCRDYDVKPYYKQ